MKEIKIYLFTSLLIVSGVALVIFSGDKHETQISVKESLVDNTIATPPVPPKPPKPPVPPVAPKAISGV